MEYNYRVTGNNVEKAIDILNVYGFAYPGENKNEIISPWNKKYLKNVIDNLDLNISLQEV